MSVFSKFCAGGIGLLLVTQVASAATITEPFGSINIPPEPNNGSFTVPQFDDLGGWRILDSVTVTLSGEAEGGSNIFDSEDTNVGYVDFIKLGSTVTVMGPATLVLTTNPIQTNSGPVSADTDDGYADNAGTDSVGVVGGVSVDSDFDTITVGLSPYIGVSTVSFSYSKVNDFSASYDVTGFISSQAPLTVFSGIVEYTYHLECIVVYLPEPASLGLIGLAACGLAGRRRRVI